MSYTDDTSDHEGTNKKSRGKKLVESERETSPSSLNKTKYSQKFLEKWLKIFDPWLTRCKDDPNKPFCRACQTKLDCNRCHLQRHEKTSKHARNLEILLNGGESAAVEHLTIRQERSKYYQQRKNNLCALSDDADFDAVDCYAEDETNENEHFEFEAVSGKQPIKEELISDATHTTKKPKRRKSVSMEDKQIVPIKKERTTTLKEVHTDKDDLMDSFKEIIYGTGQFSQVSSPPKEKSHIDLFFESVSSSVKALTPKLIAEAKMRVSQLIGELELRALTELEARDPPTSSNISYILK